MSLGILARMLAERDGNHWKAGPNNKAIATFMSPVVIHFYKADEPRSPEETLWRWIAARAVLDALGFTPPLRNSRNNKEHLATMHEAQSWFRTGWQAKEVFTNAGMPYEPVRDSVLKLIGEMKL